MGESKLGEDRWGERNSGEEREGEWTTVSARRSKVSRSWGDKTDKIGKTTAERGSWNQYGRRRQRRYIREPQYESITSFYFTNFSEDWGTESLWKMFNRWGRVIDVYLPIKRNKVGRLFSFVRFEGVQNLQDFEARLNMIWIGLFKLRVNMSRFQRDRSCDRNTSSTLKGKPQSVNTNRRGVSFAEAVKPKHGQQWVPKKPIATKSNQVTREEDDQWRGLMFNVPSEDMAWLQRCYVGEAHSPFQVDSIQDRLFEDGVLSVKVIPMGGSLCLLQPMEGEDLE